MRSHFSVFALLAVRAATTAVSLVDFEPRLSDLSSACEVVYKQPIAGCSTSDFSNPPSTSGCSQGCVEALSGLTSQVQSACGNQGIEGENIIVAFLAGQGPQSVCHNAQDYLATQSSSSASASVVSATASQTSTTTLSTSTTETSSAVQTSTSVILSGTVTATSLVTTAVPGSSSSSSGILLDTSSRPTVGSSTWSSFASSQTNVMHSGDGGGSPFDTEGNMASMATIHSSTSVTSLITVLSVFIAALR